jgi:hypothetical protein
MLAVTTAGHQRPKANWIIIRGFPAPVKPALDAPPAALSNAIGSDSQRPFSIVIVGGLLANLAIGIFLLPTLYVWMAREDDVLPAVESTDEF